jgi:hypothetical protein
MNENSVKLLQNLPGISSGQVNSLGDYLAAVFPLLITICALFAVLTIAYHGLMYMFSEIPGIKSDSKSRMEAALWGLALALAAWLILYTINPDIISTNLTAQ